MAEHALFDLRENQSWSQPAPQPRPLVTLADYSGHQPAAFSRSGEVAHLLSTNGNDIILVADSAQPRHNDGTLITDHFTPAQQASLRRDIAAGTGWSQESAVAMRGRFAELSRQGLNDEQFEQELGRIIDHFGQGYAPERLALLSTEDRQGNQDYFLMLSRTRQAFNRNMEAALNGGQTTTSLHLGRIAPGFNI